MQEVLEDGQTPRLKKNDTTTLRCSKRKTNVSKIFLSDTFYLVALGFIVVIRFHAVKLLIFRYFSVLNPFWTQKSRNARLLNQNYLWWVEFKPGYLVTLQVFAFLIRQGYHFLKLFIFINVHFCPVKKSLIIWDKRLP